MSIWLQKRMIGAGIVLLGSTMLYFFTQRADLADKNAQRSSCQSNLKQIMMGMLSYVDDYDEKYPLAKPWSDLLQPYVKREATFDCPALPTGGRYGYAYNSKLSRRQYDFILDRSKTVSIYEATTLQRNTYGMGENLAFRHQIRHQNGANYAFADGHVKWFPKTQIPSFKLKP